MREETIYVSPAGCDGNEGTREFPLKTIAAAQARARKRKGASTVEVMGGTYEESLVFNELDSNDTYITHENAVLTGGLKITYEETRAPSKEIMERLLPEAAKRVRAIDLKRYGIGKEAYGKLYAVGQYRTDQKYDQASCGYNMEVFENGCRMVPARYPNTGYLKLEAVEDVGDAAEFPPQNYRKRWDERRNHRGGVYIIDEETNEHIKGWKQPQDIWMFGYFYWDWADSSAPVTVDTANRAVMPGFVSRFGARAGGLYYFYHVLEELDSPGEFYLDTDRGILYVYPHGNGDMVFELSVAQTPLIKLCGADNMTISGFTLTNVRETAITAEGNGNVFCDLVIRNAAVHGICVNGYDNLVEGCDIACTGCGGIYLTGGKRDTLTPGKNMAQNNRIHDFSQVYRTYQAGISLSGVGNSCAHNEIFRSPHLAIAYSGNEHLIEYNHIHDVVCHSDDAGAIYSGFDWAAHGTVIRYNLVENIGEGEFSPNGIYWDDGLSGQTAYGNILRNIKKYPFLAGGGRDNTIRDNIIIGECQAPIYYDDRNREGFVNGGWAHASCDRPDAPHWRRLAAVPYQSEIWKKKYPALAKISTDFAHPDDPAFPVNPANVVVENNIIINQKKTPGYLADSVYKYNEISGDFVYRSLQEAGLDLAELESGQPFPSAENSNVPAEKIGVQNNTALRNGSFYGRI